MNVDVIILAAGQGSRMKSSLPKVMHGLGGKPMVQHVIDSVAGLGESVRRHVVIGHGGDAVRAALADSDIRFAEQAEQLGTGHAVAQAMPAVAEDSIALVLYGDVPLIKTETLDALCRIAGRDHLGLLTVKLADPSGYGRIVRNDVGDVVAIVEHKDANESQLKIQEVNTGILALPSRLLREWLPQLSADNAQGEYYLTDVIAMAADNGVRIEAIQPMCEQEVQGVNTRAQLAMLERWYQRQQAEHLMAAGVTLADPDRFDLRGELTVGCDCYFDINLVIEGQVRIAEGVSIGPNCVIKDSVIGPGTRIEANSLIEGAQVEASASIGPFARIRPGTELAEGAKIGNFVETKKAKIGPGSKVNHLSYIGDAQIGSNTNIGAGTITCNYDGVNKSLTEIGDGAFIGSNTALVAPVKVGNGATVGAGSTITKTVDDQELAVARGKQTNIGGWKRPIKRS
jgi:bifunctional UDP-N-acetylglucosamine pyrophosphorylase/glucosamine-1-phosphate N-acetyltransferase